MNRLVGEPSTQTHARFLLALHREVAPDLGRNACWSPYSVAAALGLVAEGARGTTRDELAVLLLGDKSGDLGELRAALSAAGRLEAVEPDADEPVLAVANTLWADQSITVRSAFADELSGWSSGRVRPAPFGIDPDRARREINADVAETTRDLIPELLPVDVITAETVSALVNTLYLKCAWHNEFMDAIPGPFHAPGGTVEVPTMMLVDYLPCSAVDGWQVVHLPALGGVDAVILLPGKDLADAEPELDAELLTRLVYAPVPTLIRLRLPKVDVSTRQAELAAPLKRLGIRMVFTDDADLSGISPDPLAVQEVLHESVLRLDEQGLEGAAATAVVMYASGPPMDLPEPIEINVDRPFLLLVRHAATGMVYFLARVVTIPG